MNIYRERLKKLLQTETQGTNYLVHHVFGEEYCYCVEGLMLKALGATRITKAGQAYLLYESDTHKYMIYTKHFAQIGLPDDVPVPILMKLASKCELSESQSSQLGILLIKYPYRVSWHLLNDYAELTFEQFIVLIDLLEGKTNV